MTKENPCRYCEDDRHTGCHAQCNRYKEWSLEHEGELEERRKIGRLNADIKRENKKR